MVFKDILNLLLECYELLTAFGSTVVDLVTMDLPDLLTVFLPYKPPGFDVAFDLIGLGDESLLTLMIGGGLGLIFAYTVVTWVLNIWIG